MKRKSFYTVAMIISILLASTPVWAQESTNRNMSPTYTLTVTSTGGTVTKSPNKASFNSGETVVLTAVPNVGYAFGGWSGSATGSTNPVTVTMNRNMAITAHFTSLSKDESEMTHWMLNEGQGSTATDIVNGHIAHLINDPTWGYVWADEDWISFNNQTQAIMIPTSDLSPQAGTIAVWIEPENYVGTQYILGHIFNDGNRINLYSVAGKLALGLGSSTALQTNIADLIVKQPAHIVLTWSEKSYAVYIDAIQKTKGTFEGLTALNTTMDVGNCGDPANRTLGFIGLVEDIRTYDQTLTAKEIQRLYDTYDVYQQKTLNFKIQAVDANGLLVSYRPASKLPSGSRFESGNFSWQPWYNQNGKYEIRFTAAGQPDRIITIFVHEKSERNWYQELLKRKSLYDRGANRQI